MNDGNLKPYKPGDKRAIENGRKGAFKSAESKRQQKRLKEITNILLNNKPSQEQQQELLKKYDNIKAEDITIKTLLIDKQIQKAIKGDTKAFNFICDILGELQDKELEEVKLPIFNIQVVDNSEMVKCFEQYESNQEEI